jgi:hypothetical protein
MMKAWRFALPILMLLAAVALPAGRAAAQSPPWSQAAPMLTARAGAAAAAGADGSIYVVGGRNAGGYLASAERYVPVTNTWTAIAPMHVARYDAAATLGPDGRIFAIGGYNPTNGYLNTVEAYTPATNTWAYVASMPVARAGLAAVMAAGGSIYAIGGTNGGTVLNAVMVYSLRTPSWTPVSSMPTARKGLAAVTSPDGMTIYAIGGNNASGALPTVEAYSLTGGAWSAAPPLNAARTDLAAATGGDGRIYVFGGRSWPGATTVLSSVESFLHPVGPWTFATSMLSARYNLAAAAVGHQIYLLGGVLGSGVQPVLSTVDVLTVPIAPPTTPSAPALLRTGIGPGSVTVTWKAPDDGGSPITGYRVTAYLGTSSIEAASVLAPAGATRATIAGLTNGTGYTVTVRAQNATGWSPESPRTAVLIPATVPAAPVITVISAAGPVLTVRWEAPYNGGSTITGYLVKAYVGSGPTLATTVGVTGSATHAVISGLAPGAAYSFTVKAANAVGWGAESVPYSAMILPVAPSAPANVLVVSDVGTLTVTWSPPASNGGSPITGYIVTASSGATGSVRSVSVAGSVTSTAINGLTNGATYVVTVVAVNAAGMSPASAPSTPATLPAVPAAPSNLTVVPGTTSLQVSWSAPAFNGGIPVTGYTVTVSDGVHSPTVSQVTGTSTTVSGLLSGTSYMVSVVAVNPVGSSGAVSQSASLLHVAPSLEVPADQTVTHDASINLSIAATTPETGTPLILTAGGLPTGVTFVDKGSGVGVLSGQAAVPAGSYPITISVSNGFNPPVAKTFAIKVNPEIVKVEPSVLNPTLVTVTAAHPVAASVTLHAALREITETTGFNEASETASITYTLTALAGGRVYSGSMTRSGGGVEGYLNTSYTFHNLPAGVYVLQVGVGGSYYTGTGCTFLTVRAPTTHGSVTGSGQAMVNGIRHEFTVNLQYGPNGKVRGVFSYVESHTVQGNAVMAEPYEPAYFLVGHVTGGLVITGKTVSFQGTATMNGESGYRFAVVLRGSSAGARFGLTVAAPDHTVVDHSTFPASPLVKGKIAVTG